jgi:hypothetical protein
MKQLPQPPVPTPCQEAGALAQEALDAYTGMVRAYTAMYDCSVQEALSKTQTLQSAEAAERVAKARPQQVGWFEFHTLSRHDPAQALEKWEQIKQAALDELQSGHRAARAVEANSPSPWDRAQFAAIRNDLLQASQPHNGVERQLIDMLAQARTTMLFWLEMLSVRSGIEAQRHEHDRKENGRWTPSRQTDAEAIEQAAGMVDRFNRIFLRTLRALQDLRRYGPAVVVQNAAQVNVGSQQVNVARDSSVNHSRGSRNPCACSGPSPLATVGHNGQASEATA